MSESIGQTFEDLWLSSIHPCVQGEENEVITFWKEGYFCGI